MVHSVEAIKYLIIIMKYSNFLKFYFVSLFANSHLKLNHFQKEKIYLKKKNMIYIIKFQLECYLILKMKILPIFVEYIFSEKMIGRRNLKTVVLNPKNEEAIFNLALLKIRKSNYNETKKLIKDLKVVCIDLCQKPNVLQKKLDEILKQ